MKIPEDNNGMIVYMPREFDQEKMPEWLKNSQTVNIVKSKKIAQFKYVLFFLNFNRIFHEMDLDEP